MHRLISVTSYLPRSSSCETGWQPGLKPEHWLNKSAPARAAVSTAVVWFYAVFGSYLYLFCREGKEIGFLTLVVFQSVVTFTRFDFPSEDVIAPEGIDKNDRNNQQGADQHKGQTLLRRCGLPYRYIRRNDVRPDADPKAGETEENQR